MKFNNKLRAFGEVGLKQSLLKKALKLPNGKIILFKNKGI